MNECQECGKMAHHPCRNSNDRAGCVRFHDPVTAQPRSETTHNLLALIQHYIGQAQRSAIDAVIYCAGKVELTPDEAGKLLTWKNDLTRIKREVSAMLEGEGEDKQLVPVPDSDYTGVPGGHVKPKADGG